MSDRQPTRGARLNELDDEFLDYADRNGMSQAEAIRTLVREGIRDETNDDDDTERRLQKFRDRADQGVAFFKGFAVAALIGLLLFGFSPLPSLTGPAATFATLSVMFAFASYMYAYHYSLMFLAEYEAQTGAIKRRVRSFLLPLRSVIGRGSTTEFAVETERV